MSVIAALFFIIALVLFVVDALGYTGRSLVPHGLAALTVGLFVALADTSTTVHF